MARGASGVWLRAVCRLGLLCRGTVYLLVGYLALRLALAAHGRAGAPASSAGAVQAADAWGRVPLVLLVAGLGAYALTQLIEAVFRPATRPARWALAAARGVLLGMPAVRGVLPEHRPACGAGSAGADGAVGAAAGHRRYRGAAANRLGPRGPDPGGVLAVAAGVETGRRSVRLDFRERFTAAHMPRALAIVTRALGAVGCVARAVVCVLVGVFLLKAAVLSSAKQAKGLDAVFRSVASSAYGPWLLAALASGLLCYGLYCLLEARYRDLTPGR